MTLSEKVALLEAVWAELSIDSTQVDVPEWHKSILNQREEDLIAGRAVVLDWEDAKRQIEQAVR